MKKTTLEQRLLTSRPADAGNHAFVTRTMDAVRAARGNETFNEVLRTTNATKKEHLFMKLRHLPRFAAISITIAGLAIVSGTAYAAYQLWLKPTATVQSSSQNQALIKLRNCEEYGGNTDLHIILPNSKLTPPEAAKYIQADCEIDAVQAWAMTTFQGKQKNASDILLPYTIQTVRGDTITLHDGKDRRSIQVNSSTVYVAGGTPVTEKAIAPGDTVAYVVDEKNSGTIRAIVKLALPFKYYSTASGFDNAYLIREACSGDPKAWCVNADGLDVLRSGMAGANPSAPGNWYELQGALVSHSATAFTIKDTSGALHTIPTTSDVIAAFNAGNPYGIITINAGDVLDITYRQPATANHSAVQANQVESVELLMSKISKQTDPTNSQKYHY